MRRTVVLLAAVAVLGAGACGSSAEPPVGSLPVADPVELVGLWRVDAPREGADTWLRMDARDFQLWRGTSVLRGGWDAAERELVAHAWAVSGGDGSGAAAMDAGWLTGTHGYRVTDEGWELLDDDGEPVAVMRVDGAPEPGSATSRDRARAPEVTDETRARLAPPAPLPSGLRPAAARALPGRWVPAGESFPTDPHVVFSDDGRWQGSDGCNGVGGRWAVPEDGRLLSTQGAMTAIWCEGAPVGSWVGEAARAGLDGEVLVLLGRDGTELGRLTPG